MTFTRNAAASGGTENTILTAKGSKTNFVWAYGSSNTLTYHAKRGSVDFDVASGAGSLEKKKGGSAALYAHMLCMALAWGMLLPWGVSVASRSRNVEGAAPGAWFRVHRSLQYIGWFLQIIGFVMAVLYVEEKAGAHFSANVPHTIIGLIVVVIGTLQPLNAAFRMHPPKDGWPNGVVPFKRRLFEWVHKGGGRVSVLLGMVNVIFGVLLVQKYNYSDSLVTIASVLAGLGIAPVCLHFVASTLSPNNPVAKLCVGASAGAGKSSAAVAPEKDFA